MTQPQPPDNWRDRYDEGWNAWYPGFLRELSDYLKQSPLTQHLIENMLKFRDVKIEEFFDKSKWGDGPWSNEPDKISWVDNATNLPCLIVRNSFGAWCGYVGVNHNHPYFRKHYSSLNLEAHWDVNFSNFSQKGDVSGVLHPIEYDDESNVLWYLGFDCSHYGDLIPLLQNPYAKSVYRNAVYAMKGVESLARQLNEAIKA